MWIRDAQKQMDPTDPGFGKLVLTSFFKDKKVMSYSHKTVEIRVFLTIFAWWWKDPDPDPYLWLTDPDADPGGPKTYGSYKSGSVCGSGNPHTANLLEHNMTWTSSQYRGVTLPWTSCSSCSSLPSFPGSGTCSCPVTYTNDNDWPVHELPALALLLLLLLDEEPVLPLIHLLQLGLQEA